MQEYEASRLRRVALFLVLAWFSVSSGSGAVPAGVPIVWQHHHSTFTYVGLATLYMCDALESQVKRILKYFGARADMRVMASCAQPVLPTRQAIIDVDFYSPDLSDASVADAAIGRWTPVGLESGHPNFIGAGDCDLIEDMKRLITDGFTLRELDYRTSCFPNELTLHDFDVKGEALKATAPTQG